MLINDSDLELTEKLKAARGKQFLVLLDMAIDKIGPYLQAEIKKRNGKVTVLDIAQLSVSYNLHFKTCTEMLEKLKILPTGTFLSLKDRGLNVKKVMAEAAKKDVNEQNT